MDREIPDSVKKARIRRVVVRVAAAVAAVVAIVMVLPRMLERKLSLESVRTGVVDRGTIEISIGASGKLAPLFEEIIVSPINTRIVEVYKEDGDRVTEGEPLLKLELASAETDYRQKLDELEIKRSKVVQVGVRLDNTISELRMQQQIREMQVQQLLSEFENERYLDSIGAGTRDKVRRAELNYREAELQLAQIGQKIENEEKNAGSELRVQQLELDIFEKGLREKERLLDNARVLSPRTATLTFINKQVGAQVSAGAQLAVVSDLSSFKVECEIGDNHLEKLSPGGRALVRVGEVEMTGTIVNITSSVTNGIVKFTVVPDQSDHPGLRSGLAADVYVLYGLSADVLRVPNGAFRKYGAGVYDMWVVAGDRLEKRSVAVGNASHEYVEVVSGLAGGETVVISDMGEYADQNTIKIKKTSKQ